MSWITFLYIVYLLFSLALFGGLFFSYGLPEIRHAQYIQTTCTVLAEAIDSRYCCYLSCNCAEAAPLAQTCDSLQSQYNLLSPTTCAAAVHNSSIALISSKCPNNSIECNNGYYCCSTCCETCTTCSTTCSTSGVCSQSCTSYICNCYCCDSVNSQQCYVNCPTCYTAILNVQYHPFRTSPAVNATITTDFNTALNDSESYLAAHQVGSTPVCWYNPDDYQDVLLSVAFNSGLWVGIGFAAILLFIALSLGTWILFQYELSRERPPNRNSWYRPRYEDYETMPWWRSTAMECNILLWVTFLWPAVFLMIRLVGSADRAVLLALVLVFIPWGAMLFGIRRIKDRFGWPITACLAVYMLFAVIPLMVFGIVAVYSSTVQRLILFSSLAGGIPFMGLVMLAVPWGIIGGSVRGWMSRWNLPVLGKQAGKEQGNEPPPPYELELRDVE